MHHILASVGVFEKMHKHAGKIPKCQVGKGDKSIAEVSSGFEGGAGEKDHGAGQRAADKHGSVWIVRTRSSGKCSIQIN